MIMFTEYIVGKGSSSIFSAEASSVLSTKRVGTSKSKIDKF